MWELRVLAEGCNVSLPELLSMVDIDLERALNFAEKNGFVGARERIKELEKKVRELRKTLAEAKRAG